MPAWNTKSSMRSYWKNLSVAKKLYTVVGIMAILVATELFTLLFVMDILSSVRSFVGGEGLWSKAQKNATHQLYLYVQTKEESHYQNFLKELEVIEGDRNGRLALEEHPENYERAYKGFIQGGIHPHDIPGLIRIIHRFRDFSYVKESIEIWREGEILIFKLKNEAHLLQTNIQNKRFSDIHKNLKRVESLNQKLSKLEYNFSNVLGEGSRWLENLMTWILLFAVLTVEGSGLFLTWSFTRSLKRNLNELGEATAEIEKGNFQHQVPVHSQDELGMLAASINRMTTKLEHSIGLTEEAQNASREKSLFLANMSHEIRTPLGIILGITEILKQREVSSEERKKFIETIDRTGKNLNRIINDILDLSKVEAGHLEIEKSRFPISEFIQSLHVMLKLQAESQNTRLSFKSQGRLPSFVIADQLRLKQILLNLVSNAIKFTKNGSVEVLYYSVGNQLIFDIKDTGIGMDKEFKKKIFKTFTQGDNSSTRLYAGTGLGLALSKKLAQELGGDVILLSSEVGVGSLFRVSIANQPSDLKHVKKSNYQLLQKHIDEEALGLRHKKILVVEDSEDIQDVLKAYLERFDLNLDFANNGLEGIKKVFETDYDAILMDMQMPVMDGYEATSVLREKGFKRPIIALTAHAMKDDRERCLLAGCDEYLTKPIDATLLYSTLVHYCLDENSQKTFQLN